MTSNATNEENIKCRLFEMQTKENKQLQLVRDSIKEKMERMSKMSGQIAKLSDDHIKRIRYAPLKSSNI